MARKIHKDFLGNPMKTSTCKKCNVKYSYMSITRNNSQYCAPCQNKLDGIEREPNGTS